MLTDGDYDWSTCISVFLTREQADKEEKKYLQKHPDSNVCITEVLLEPGDFDEEK